MTTPSTVPFSPVPGHPQSMKYSDGWTHEATPLRVLWEDNYRRAAVRLVYGQVDEARQYAETGIAMEDAYMQRASDEYHRERARPASATVGAA